MRRFFNDSPVAVALLVVTGLCAILLVAPANTVTSRYFNDVLVFLDGGYRVMSGQVPNREFHTALGPLAFYVPGVGYWLSGRLGMAMPLGMAALMLLVTPIAIHVLQTRMRPLIAIPTGTLLLLVLAAPHNTGELVTSISFAMFYNRIGWALLGLLLVMYLVPSKPVRWQTELDTSAAVLLTLLLLYTKISYGLVALAFLVLMLLQPRQRHWAGFALLITGVCIGLIELIWGGTRAHIDDLIVAAGVSGSRPIEDYAVVLLANTAEYAPFALVAGLALWRTRSVGDFLFFGLCAGAGLALLMQNFQDRGIISLFVGAAVAAELLARSWHSGMSFPSDIAARGSWLVLLFLMLPLSLASGGALGLHAALAFSGAGTNLDLPNAQGLKVAKTIDHWDFVVARGYADTLQSGGDLLLALDEPPTKVLVFDFGSPFSSLLGLEAPTSGTAWMHDGRNFNGELHFPPETFLRGVEVVMIPKRPIAASTTHLMKEIYGEYFRQHFEPTLETDEWKVLRRPDSSENPRESDPALQAAGTPSRS